MLRRQDVNSEFVGNLTDKNITAALELERLHKAGEISDPIEALITFEKLKHERGFLPTLAPIIIAFGIPFLFFALAIPTLPRFFPSYNFYWGDYVQSFDKRRSITKVFWSAIVLGILASIIAGVLLRYI